MSMKVDFWIGVLKTVAAALIIAFIFSTFTFYRRVVIDQPEIDKDQNIKIDSLSYMFNRMCKNQSKNNELIIKYIDNIQNKLQKDSILFNGIIENQKIIYRRMDNMPKDLIRAMDNNIVLKSTENNWE